MIAVFKREFMAYFRSPLGYVFIAAYYLLSGFFFFNYNLYGNSTDMRSLFSVLFTVTLFLIPILTMRLFSEDKRQKTDQILLMSPVSSTGIVLGKYLSAICVYFIAMAVTLIMAVVLSIVSRPEWPVIIGHFIGLFLLGCGLIAIGMFISSLTENQIIAAVGGFVTGFFLMLLNSLAAMIDTKLLSDFVLSLSFQQRYQSFTLGILNASDIFFFISVVAIFVFFTVFRFYKRRIE